MLPSEGDGEPSSVQFTNSLLGHVCYRFVATARALLPALPLVCPGTARPLLP